MRSLATNSPCPSDPAKVAFWRAFASFSSTLTARSEEHTSELQSPCNLVCRLLLEKKKNRRYRLPTATMSAADLCALGTSMIVGQQLGCIRKKTLGCPDTVMVRPTCQLHAVEATQQ